MKWAWGIMMMLTGLWSNAQTDSNMNSYAIAVHGGAGAIRRTHLSPESEKAYRAKLKEALDAGHQVLRSGGTSVDAVTEAIRILEDSPLFNAGKGSVYTYEGKHEMDASIMSGKDLNAGAVAGVGSIRNPIVAAREVMLHCEHVMLSGAGAEQFAHERGTRLVDPGYFHDERRLEQLKRAKERENVILDHDGEQGSRDPANADIEFEITKLPDDKFGTVGCVALDSQGNLAAGTSTGGMTNKRYGRIGDSPIIGAGTYADNRTCAVSCTGHGEFFIRAVAAKEVSAQMEHAGRSLKEAADHVIHTELASLGGLGGIIAIDAQGNIAMPFNTSGMYRGYIDRRGNLEISIFKDH